MPRKFNTRQTSLRAVEPMPLMDLLLQKMGGMKRTSVKGLLSHRCVKVNGHVETRHDYALAPGDEVTITRGAERGELRHPKLSVVYEDDDIIVVEKKCGLLTVATNMNSRETTAFALLKQYVRQSDPRGGVYVVHRLDRETSGLLVFARSRETQEYMRENWRQIVTQRTYVAVVEGDAQNTASERPAAIMEREGEEFTITSWLTENPKSTVVRSSATDNGGKLAVTHFRIIKSNGHHSLLELHLDTGRTNQIRVHAQAIGHPVVGDRKYGSGKTDTLDRLALHARILEFKHPRTGQIMHFETPVPRDMLALFH